MKIPVRLRSSKFVIVLIALLGLTACDLYPDSGDWQGVGTVYFDESHQQRASCSLDLKIAHTGDLVAVDTLSADCGSRSRSWSPGAFNRRGTELWQDNRQVGQIFPDGTVKLELREPYYGQFEKTVITWTRMGEELHVTVQEIGKGQLRTLEAWLHRAS